MNEHGMMLRAVCLCCYNFRLIKALPCVGIQIKKERKKYADIFLRLLSGMVIEKLKWETCPLHVSQKQLNLNHAKTHKQ